MIVGSERKRIRGESIRNTYRAPISVASPSSSISKSGLRAQHSTTILYRSSSKGYPKRILSLIDWCLSHGLCAAYEIQCMNPFSSTREESFDITIWPSRRVISPRTASWAIFIRYKEKEKRKSRHHTNNAVFPDAVGPVTTVNAPSGNKTETSRNRNENKAETSRNRNEWPSSPSEPLSSSEPSANMALASLSENEVVRMRFFCLGTALAMRVPALCFADLDTAFHLSVACSRPSPPWLFIWFECKFGWAAFKDDTWSVTSSSSRKTAMRFRETPAYLNVNGFERTQEVWTPQHTWKSSTKRNGSTLRGDLVE